VLKGDMSVENATYIGSTSERLGKHLSLTQVAVSQLGIERDLRRVNRMSAPR
jgi:hypothetical protein